jgi:hypothetical protein
MPAKTGTANDRCRRYYCRRHHNRSYGCDYDRSVRPTSAVWPTVKADTASASSTGAVNAEKGQEQCRRRGRQ